MERNKVSIATFLLLATSLISTNVSAEIFKWVDEKGNIHFGDKKPSNQVSEELELKTNTFKALDAEDIKNNSNKKVVIYTTARCRYCRQAKNYFKKNKISYTEYDIDKNLRAKRKFKNLGGRGVPLILVGGNKMSGFSEKGFDRIYKKN